MTSHKDDETPIFGGLPATLEQVATELRALRVDVNAKLAKLDAHLTGGSDPSRGFVIRVDRAERDIADLTAKLKESADNQKWLFRTAVVALITGAVSLVLKLVPVGATVKPALLWLAGQ